MTKFESIGVERQMEAESVYQANRTFQYSCKMCSEHGMWIDCDRCAIAKAHAEQVSLLQAMADDAAEREKEKHAAPVQVVAKIVLRV